VEGGKGWVGAGRGKEGGGDYGEGRGVGIDGGGTLEVRGVVSGEVWGVTGGGENRKGGGAGRGRE